MIAGVGAVRIDPGPAPVGGVIAARVAGWLATRVGTVMWVRRDRQPARGTACRRARPGGALARSSRMPRRPGLTGCLAGRGDVEATSPATRDSVPGAG